MVSGLVTSPWDQERIFSGLARLIRMESKSAIKLARSYGLLRYKVVSFLPSFHWGCVRVSVLKDADRGRLKTLTSKTAKLKWLPRPGAACCAPTKTTRCLVGGFLRRLLPLHQLDIKTERLQLTDEHVKRLGHARLDARLALDDGLVDFRATIDIVGLRGKQLLQDVRGSVRFERPDFHFAEALAAELRLATKRLLGDERVGADGARVNLVVDKMRELEHVDVADGDGLIELVARHAVGEIDFPGVRETRDFEQVADFGFARAVKHGRGEGNALAEALGDFQKLVVIELGETLPDSRIAEDFAEPAAQSLGPRFLAEQALKAAAEFLGGPAEMRLEDLTDVHTRRNAERVEHNLDRSAVRHIGHVFLGNDARDDALVAMASGHL